MSLHSSRFKGPNTGEGPFELARRSLRAEGLTVFKRILVPLDGSSFGESALRPAVSLARRSGGELRLLSVHDHDQSSSRPDLHARFRSWREEYLDRVGRVFLDVPTSAVVREGSPEMRILEEADSWGADLIVMSTHGRGAASRFWLGSVADHCLRNARLPLLLVRAVPSAMGNADPLFAPKRLVVPLDGSELAERGLDPAITLAETFGATLALIRVVTELPSAVPVRLEQSSPNPTNLGEVGARALLYLQDIAESLRRRGLAVTTEVVAGQHPAYPIIEHAAGDLVVIATRSRSAFHRAPIGSVTDKVVRGIRGAVLAIPASASCQGCCGNGKDCSREVLAAAGESARLEPVVRRGT
jgi:nucleotide-binding universal stress UspA family protein